ncbi:MAG: FtsQ-type POTRA domain-containing protein [Sphingomonadaceae bacterium]|nr:FtsQ-type POTRA domain-containing protein [Sphingomonadaceae bacterium]
MSERISLRRGQVPKPAKKRPARRPVRNEPSVRLPVAPRSLRRWVGGAVAALVAVGGVTALWLMELPQQAWFETARSVGEAGFEVRHVEVTGLKNMAKLPVYGAALNGPTNSMLLIDLDDIRTQLQALPWVADASVGRRLPDTLVIDIVERKPLAIWQHQRKLAVVDREGKILDTKRIERFAALPLIVGPRANLQAHPLMAMLADFPEVQQRVDSAIWIGDRRWDLRLKSGETLALPEGYAAATGALKQFQKMEQDNGLLDRGFVRFDLRLPDRMVVRISGEPGAQALPYVGTEI